MNKFFEELAMMKVEQEYPELMSAVDILSDKDKEGLLEADDKRRLDRLDKQLISEFRRCKLHYTLNWEFMNAENRTKLRTEVNAYAKGLPFQTWLGFSTRMVDEVFTVTPERRVKIRGKVVDYIERFRGYPLVGWDHKHSETEMYMCDHFDEWFEEYYVWTSWGQDQSKFLMHIVSAVRAGLDMAVPKQASSGVVGFTVGDLRKMYPEGLPDYITDWFDPPLTPEAKDGEHVWL